MSWRVARFEKEGTLKDLVVRVHGHYVSGCLGVDTDNKTIAVDVSDVGLNGLRCIRVPPVTVRLVLAPGDSFEFRDRFPKEKIDMVADCIWWDTTLGWVDSFSKPTGPPRMIVPVLDLPQGLG